MINYSAQAISQIINDYDKIIKKIEKIIGLQFGEIIVHLYPLNSRPEILVEKLNKDNKLNIYYSSSIIIKIDNFIKKEIDIIINYNEFRIKLFTDLYRLNLVHSDDHIYNLRYTNNKISYKIFDSNVIYHSIINFPIKWFNYTKEQQKEIKRILNIFVPNNYYKIRLKTHKDII